MSSTNTKNRKKKDEQFMHSANPELWAKANKPTSTIAMGMKSNQLSSECWRNQVQREKQIAAGWYKTYKCGKHSAGTNEAIDGNNSEQGNDELIVSLQNTRAREAASHNEYHNPSLNPELHNILYNSAGDMRATYNVSCESNDSKVCSDSNHINFGKTINKEKESTSESAAVLANPSLERKTLSTWEQQGLPTTQLYLKARAQNHSLPERYPHGPTTSSQVIGWNATQGHSHAADTDVYRIDPELYKPYQQHQSSTFHRPDDKEHAQLLGYDFDVK